MGDEQGSEFGRGLVVCLAKFSGHLENDRAAEVRHLTWWIKQTPKVRAEVELEARLLPRGDSADIIRSISRHGGNEAAALSRAIVMWMNGASDHFYDLDESAPAPLKELAELTLRIGHGWFDEIWTPDHVEQILELWTEACVAMDELLGIKDVDWGKW